MLDPVEPEGQITAMLRPHPGGISGPTVQLEVKLERQGDLLWVRFIVAGDVGAVKWPTDQGGGRADRLWEQTCFEVFFQTADGYREFNLSSSGQWASYGFSGYREGMTEAAEVVTVSPPDLASDRLALEAHLDLPASAGKLALSAVIEALNGDKTYWALAHPSDKPDFHHPDSFILDLP